MKDPESSSQDKISCYPTSCWQDGHEELPRSGSDTAIQVMKAELGRDRSYGFGEDCSRIIEFSRFSR